MVPNYFDNVMFSSLVSLIFDSASKDVFVFCGCLVTGAGAVEGVD